MKSTLILTTIPLLAALTLSADTKLQMKDLPPPVQTAIQEQTKGSTVLGFSKEVEKGKTSYEVETKVSGKSRDLSFDKTGALLSVEQEVDLNSIPGAAKEAIQTRAAGGTIKKVESVTVGSTVSYEADVKMRSGKTAEVAVNADGTPHKD